MSKTSKCIEMLLLLNSGRMYSASEIAEKLEINPRNVIEYKRELEDCGYYFDNTPGKNGGYRIRTSALLPVTPLTNPEKQSLIEGYNYILKKKDFIYKDDYEKAMGRIMARVEIGDKENNLMVVDRYQLQMDEKSIQERYDFIDNAISKKRVVELEYNSLKNGLKTHVLHPYKLFIYNNSWFFLAYNPEVGDVWYFKLNRIKTMKLLDQRFTVWKDFKPEKYFDKMGLTQNGEVYNIKFIANGIRANLLKERVYGKNQVITEREDGRYDVSIDMQNKDMIASYILGCGKDVEVLEPQWLKDEIKSYVEYVSSLYK